MRRTAPTLLLLLAACTGGSEAPDGRARAIEALGGREAFAGVRELAFGVKGTLGLRSPERSVEAQYRAENLLRVPDGLAVRSTADGVLMRSAVSGETAWVRMGAVVRDLDGADAAEEAEIRDDFLCLMLLPLAGEGALDGREIEYDPATGLPVRISRGDLRIEVREWREAGPLKVPARIVRTYRAPQSQVEQRLVAEIRDVVANPTEPGAPRFERPDDSGRAKLGEIGRKRLPARDIVAATHHGPMLDLAKVDHFMERALSVSLARRRSPNARIFAVFPDVKGNALVKTFVEVSLSHDSGAQDLPTGAVAEHLPATDVLYAEAVGPYPTDDSIYAPLRERAVELGLTPSGPPRHYLLSRPDEGEPNELRQEIRLPVTEGR